ncbi:MAG: sugar transferase [Granulosicoccus sp.]
MPLQHRLIKRLFDFVASAIGLALLWPVIVICMIIARRDTGLSGIFSQSRVGQYGKMIKVHKIRTMRRVEGVNTSVTVVNDIRITPAGRKLRRLKLDELPQLWNVFIGDMSFVGPRPDVPGYADSLKGEERFILELRPGITGPATIKYTDEEMLLSRFADAKAYNDAVVYPDKVRLNLAYLREWSLMGDLRYILITLHLLSKPEELDTTRLLDGDKA